MNKSKNLEKMSRIWSYLLVITVSVFMIDSAQDKREMNSFDIEINLGIDPENIPSEIVLKIFASWKVG